MIWFDTYHIRHSTLSSIFASLFKSSGLNIFNSHHSTTPYIERWLLQKIRTGGYTKKWHYGGLKRNSHVLVRSHSRFYIFTVIPNQPFRLMILNYTFILTFIIPSMFQYSWFLISNLHILYFMNRWKLVVSHIWCATPGWLFNTNISRMRLRWNQKQAWLVHVNINSSNMLLT